VDLPGRVHHARVHHETVHHVTVLSVPTAGPSGCHLDRLDTAAVPCAPFPRRRWGGRVDRSGRVGRSGQGGRSGLSPRNAGGDRTMRRGPRGTGGSNWSAHPNPSESRSSVGRPNWVCLRSWAGRRSSGVHRIRRSCEPLRRNCEPLRRSCGSVRRSRFGPDGPLSSVLPRRPANFRPVGAVGPSHSLSLAPSLPPSLPRDPSALPACPFHRARWRRAAVRRRDDQAGGNQQASSKFRRAIPPTSRHHDQPSEWSLGARRSTTTNVTAMTPGKGRANPMDSPRALNPTTKRSTTTGTMKRIFSTLSGRRRDRATTGGRRSAAGRRRPRPIVGPRGRWRWRTADCMAAVAAATHSPSTMRVRGRSAR
jgi:hypothetical protein